MGKFNDAEYEYYSTEFKADLNAYLARLGPRALCAHSRTSLNSMSATADKEMPFLGRTLSEGAGQRPLTEKGYLDGWRKADAWPEKKARRHNESTSARCAGER